MVIIATSYNATVDFEDQVDINWSARVQLGYPAIGLHSRARLPLRTCHSALICIVIKCGVQLIFSEVRTFDFRSTGDLVLQLNLLQLVSPCALIRNGRQRQYGSLRLR